MSEYQYYNPSASYKVLVTRTVGDMYIELQITTRGEHEPYAVEMLTDTDAEAIAQLLTQAAAEERPEFVPPPTRDTIAPAVDCVPILRQSPAQETFGHHSNPQPASATGG